jgi:hypothetical protein
MHKLRPWNKAKLGSLLNFHKASNKSNSGGYTVLFKLLVKIPSQMCGKIAAEVQNSATSQ